MTNTLVSEGGGDFTWQTPLVF